MRMLQIGRFVVIERVLMAPIVRILLELLRLMTRNGSLVQLLHDIA